ncbi:hypothetical protein GWI33_000692 [Rhynchophorus ferrugineus]|uniref:Fe2OG dioxygenase domain-containing protein n=1 Tax=Rhynchophorus ferrugineus TaxID=354439 RepID=A0A834IMJ6_RHYFE|nr:hypothetical protein GWI33_000692 [Rhynchophorus ferrugineus]
MRSELLKDMGFLPTLWLSSFHLIYLGASTKIQNPIINFFIFLKVALELSGLKGTRFKSVKPMSESESYYPPGRTLSGLRPIIKCIGELEVAQYRISKSAWLKEDEDERISVITRRINDMTGLTMSTAEELQVVNYGIGGHYEPHFDFARKEETNAFRNLGTGNRIATVLFYMSDVEQGGATVFPVLKTALWPKKGTAAFWFNLFESGHGDKRTRHAACPVLAGSKWVSNKWIHEAGQEFLRPCLLNPPPEDLTA